MGEKSYLKYGATYGNDSTVAEGIFYRFTGRNVGEETQVSVVTKCNSGGASYTLTFKNFKLSRGKHSGNVEVTCSAKGKKQFNSDDQYTSHVICNEPKNFCQRAFGANGGEKSGGGCHESCVKNGRCHPNNITQARNLKEMLIMSLGIDGYRRELGTMAVPHPDRRPTPKKAPTTRRLGWMDDFMNDDDWEGDDSWGDDSWNTPSKNNGGNTKPAKKPENTKPATKPEDTTTPATKPSREDQAEETASGDWKCWCYSDGQERTVCPSIANELK